MNLQCQQCQSDSTQKLSLAVDAGTFRTTGQTIGVGASGSGVGVFGGSSKGKSVSKTAEKYAEPDKAPTIQGPLAIMVVAGVVSIFAGSGAITVGLWVAGIAMAFCLWYNFSSFPAEHAAWDAKYMCLRCGHVFTPETAQVGGAPAEVTP